MNNFALYVTNNAIGQRDLAPRIRVLYPESTGGNLKETGIFSVWKTILRPPSPTSNILRGGAGLGKASCFSGATPGSSLPKNLRCCASKSSELHACIILTLGDL
ncbi:hypothetical protein PUN28_004831 [Cardiocondyla obscurior]|uniref:Uncharacterized protein n=1 Tax=Cardiocondyla obscurior TaxID=286306 RepID=A0AAW2GGP1_9HYME